MLSDQIEGKNNSWAIRWQASAFLNNKLTLYPGIPLVKNIGFDNTGTHTEKTKKYYVKLSKKTINVKKIQICESSFARDSYMKYFQSSSKPKLHKRMINKLKSIKKLANMNFKIFKKETY